MDTIRVILRSNDLVAVLGREIPVRLVNVSGSGCLVATTSSLHAGVTASVRLEFEGVEYTDDVRVARCTRIEGSSEYHLGLEFSLDDCSSRAVGAASDSHPAGVKTRAGENKLLSLPSLTWQSVGRTGGTADRDDQIRHLCKWT